MWPLRPKTTCRAHFENAVFLEWAAQEIQSGLGWLTVLDQHPDLPGLSLSCLCWTIIRMFPSHSFLPSLPSYQASASAKHWGMDSPAC